MLITAPADIQFTNNTLCAARTNVKGFYFCRYVNSQQMRISFSFKLVRMLQNNEGTFNREL